MPEPKELLSRMEDYLNFLAGLRPLPWEVLLSPMAKGKWSIREVVAHITAWDLNFLETAVRAIEGGGRPVLTEEVDYQAFNERAAAIGRTQTKEQLLSEAAGAREKLLDHLRRLPAEAFQVRGSGEAGTDLAEFLERNFVSHDRHHMEQVRRYLAERPSA